MDRAHSVLQPPHNVANDVEIVLENRQDGREEEPGETNFKRKMFLQFVLCFTMFNAGWNSGQQGPVFEDLMMITGVSPGKGSVFISVFSAGKVIGSMSCGILIDRYNKALIMASGAFSVACSAFITPLCSFYWSMIIVYGIQGFGDGVMRTGSLASCGQLWTAKTTARSSMHLMLLCLPVGAILSPLVVAPFLSSGRFEGNATTEITNVKETNALHEWYSTVGHDDTTTLAFKSEKRSERNFTYANVTMYSASIYRPQRLIIPFSIFGAMVLTTSILLLAIFCMNSAHNPNEKNCGQPIKDNTESPPLTMTVRVLRLYLVGQITLLDRGLLHTFIQFLPACVFRKMGWNKITSSDIMSVFWGLFAFSRLTGIWISYHIKSTNFLFIDIVLALISEIILLIGLYGNYDSMMWVSTATMGIAVSTIAPSFLNWMQCEILSSSGKHASYYMVMGSLGQIVFSLTVGNLVEIDYIWFAYTILGAGVVYLFNYIILFLFVRCKPNQRKYINATTVQETDEESHMTI